METKNLFSEAEAVVVEALINVCQEKMDMLKKSAENKEEKFDMKAYNALEAKENALKGIMVQFSSANDFLVRMAK